MLKQTQAPKNKLSHTLRSWLPILSSSVEELKETLEPFLVDNPFASVQQRNLSELPSAAPSKKEKNFFKEISKNSVTDNIESFSVAKTGLYDKLIEQIDKPLFPTEKSKKIAMKIIECINEEGYYEPEAFDEFSEAEIESVRKRFAYLEPAGIGAKDYKESFLFQLEELNLDEVLSSLKVGEPRELKHLKTSEKLSEKIIIKPSEQAYVYFGAPFSVPCEERFKARVATFILGDGGFGSRLMEEIRVKRGLAYSAYARSEFALSYSQIWGYLQTKNESRDEAVAVVKDEFKKFVKNGVKAGELAQAKRFLLGSQPLRQETLFNRLSIAQGEFYNGFKLGNFKDELEKISKLKLAELNAFIAEHAEIEKLSFAVLYNEI